MMATLNQMRERLKEIENMEIPTDLSRADETILLIKLRSERESLLQEIKREDYRARVRVLNNAERT